jgi:hypothetical protein
MSIFQTLGFSQEWVDAGVVTPESLRRLEAEWVKGEDRHAEHYRWRAFWEFIEAQESLSESTARALYDIGANDPDSAMGGSIMADIVRRKDCPRDLLERAANSDRKFLRKLARERMAAQVAD